MKMTIEQLMTRMAIVTTLINENRPMPLKGRYRLTRLHAKMLPEYNVVDAQRSEMIRAFDYHEPTMGKDESGEMVEVGHAEAFSVPPDKMKGEWAKQWAEFASEEIEIEGIQPIPLSQIDLGENVNASISATEIWQLGDLIAED